ncbi:MAG: response regulator [Lachnospiraceae bacterium]|nr:response regulator [Lachnospiraceae bacterium]
MTGEEHILIIGNKETFLVRTVLKKLNDARMNAIFAKWDISEINEFWEGTSLFIIYMDNGEVPPDDVLHFIEDKTMEESKLVIPIGEKTEVDYINRRMPSDIIYQSFVRPINNEELITTVQGLLERQAAGYYKKSILIVDDDPTYLSMVREWLKQDYKVAMANSGLQALRWLGKNQADLILLDYEMPVTSGPQVLEMLRSDLETSKIPVMFLTGKSDKNSVLQVLALKPEGYFLKTIEKDELLQKLSDFFFRQIGG